MTTELLLYEEPANDLIKTCLRIESLLKQADFHLDNVDPENSHITFIALIELIKALDRNDFKATLAKELQRCLAILLPLAQMTQIDRSKLSTVLHDLETTITQLRETPGKFAQSLLKNEFLTQVSCQMAFPTLNYRFEIPAYQCWLQQPATARIGDLTEWLQELDLAKKSISLLLRLLRQSTAPMTYPVERGIYQSTTPPLNNCQLIRVWIDKVVPAFPQIFISRGRVNIQFYQPSNHKRPVLVQEKLTFQMACCGL